MRGASSGAGVSRGPAVPGGATSILGATVVAGVAGYVVTWFVYRQVGPAPYALFAVFWAALYLVIGGLSGIQQEITRATRPRDGAPQRTSRTLVFGVVAALLVAAAVLITAPLWVEATFVSDGWPLVWAIAAGAASYVLVATLSGTLYGVSQWRSLAFMIGADGILRVLAVGSVLLVSHDILLLAWAVVVPFPLAILLLWPIVRHGVVGRTQLDVGYRALSWNVSRTVVASISTAALVSGFPLLVGVASAGVDAAYVGELIFTITLTRAPLIVTVMALQSYLLVRFRDHPTTWLATFWRIIGMIGLGGAVLAVLGWLLGPTVFSLVSGRAATIDGEMLAELVASSALVGALCVTAPAVLAKGEHVVYTLGWVAAAIVTVVLMLAPLEFELRVALALIAGPIAGLLVNASWLVLSSRARAGV